MFESMTDLKPGPMPHPPSLMHRYEKNLRRLQQARYVQGYGQSVLTVFSPDGSFDSVQAGNIKILKQQQSSKKY